ncbi:hypothetical protein [Mycobacterium saskatchewanense]|nr:hypothetical protein [Mycobacterium saskatchewanense]
MVALDEQLAADLAPADLRALRHGLARVTALADGASQAQPDKESR